MSLISIFGLARRISARISSSILFELGCADIVDISLEQQMAAARKIKPQIDHGLTA